MSNEAPKITSETLRSLASKYNVDARTMRKWLLLGGLLKPKEQGYIYTPKEVAKIYNHLGNP